MNLSPQARMAADGLLERINDAIESAMGRHEAVNLDSRCTCGVRNNMDGDVLFTHRVGMVSEAVRGVLAAAVSGEAEKK